MSEPFAKPIDLELRIHRGPDDRMAAGLRLPWGELVTRRLDPPPLGYLADTARGGVRAGAAAARPDKPDNYLIAVGRRPASPLIEYGSALWDWIFQERFLDDYVKVREMAGGRSADPPGPAVRLGVGFGPGSEALWPVRWELLYDRPARQFFALGGGVRRYLLHAPSPRPDVGWPLRVLCLTAADPSLPPDLGAALADAVQEASRMAPGASVLTRHQAVADFDALRQAVRDAGSVHGMVLLARLERAGGRVGLNLGGRPTPWADLADALAATWKAPGLVYVAALAADGPAGLPDLELLAPDLLRVGVKSVVSIQGELDPEGVWRFTAAWFRGGFSGRGLDQAVVEGRRELERAGPPWGWAGPVLFTQTPESDWFEPPSEGLRSVLATLEKIRPTGTW
jgi:hypothetical protein